MDPNGLVRKQRNKSEKVGESFFSGKHQNFFYITRFNFKSVDFAPLWGERPYITLQQTQFNSAALTPEPGSVLTQGPPVKPGKQ